MFTVLQINLNNSRRDHDLLCQTVGKLKVDVIIASEYNANAAKERWFRDPTARAAIWIPNNTRVQLGPRGSGGSFVEGEGRKGAPGCPTCRLRPSFVLLRCEYMGTYASVNTTKDSGS